MFQIAEFRGGPPTGIREHLGSAVLNRQRLLRYYTSGSGSTIHAFPGSQPHHPGRLTRGVIHSYSGPEQFQPRPCSADGHSCGVNIVAA